jgi:deoxyribonuclease II
MFLSVALKKPNGTSYRSMNVYDEKNNDEEWKCGDDINEWIGSVIRSINNIKNNRQRNLICYNDEEPGESKSTSKGHAKGVILWDTNRIGWLIHSVPKYPQMTNDNTFHPIEPPQLIYGQSFLYMEIDYTQSAFKTILDHLSLMEVHIYHQTDPSHTLQLARVKEKVPVTYHFRTNVVHVAKSSIWGKDLYEDYLYEYMNSIVLCETWGKPAAPSTNKVKNVRNVRWTDDDHYQTTQDHSKYAVSMDRERPWVLFGDLNHMDSQAKRGGGGMLICHPVLWRAMNELLVDYTEFIPNPNHENQPDKKWWNCFGWKCLEN